MFLVHYAYPKPSVSCARRMPKSMSGLLHAASTHRTALLAISVWNCKILRRRLSFARPEKMKFDGRIAHTMQESMQHSCFK